MRTRTKDLYIDLKLHAKELFTRDDLVDELANDKVVMHVSSTVSDYIRNNVKKMCERNIKDSHLDFEIGIIDKETMEKEIRIENLIIKSVMYASNL